jgi:5-methylcytosine-specific restriction endonuclease McrA
MSLEYFSTIFTSLFNSVGAVIFWFVAALILLFTLWQTWFIVYEPIRQSILGLGRYDDSKVRKFILKPAATFSMIPFGLSLLMINMFVFALNGFIIMKYLNGWVIAALFILGFIRIPFLINILALGLSWYNHGISGFLSCFLINLLAPMLSLLFAFQSTADDDASEQEKYFGYPREILLIGCLCCQYLAVPLYQLSDDFSGAGWVVSDLIGSGFLLLHLFHSIKYFSKKKTAQEFKLEDVNSLYRTSPWYYLLLIFLSSNVFYTYEYINSVKGEFFCAIACPIWLNVLACIGLVLFILRKIKSKFFLRAEAKNNKEILELILNKAEEKLSAEEMKEFCSPQLPEDNHILDSNFENENHIEQEKKNIEIKLGKKYQSQLSENNQKLDSNSEKKNHVEQEKKNIEIKHQSQLSENNQKTTNNQTKRTCKKCDQMYPLNEDYFGYTPSGNFRHSCRKCMSLVAKKHDKENPDMVKKRQAQRKQRITKSPLARDYSPKDLKIKLYALSNAKCHYCKKSFKQDDLDLEHQIPVVQDGPDIQSNIVLACGFCNKEKHGKTENQYRQFLKERGRNVEF